MDVQRLPERLESGTSSTPEAVIALDPEAGGEANALSPGRRIFTCRNLRFDQISQVGFDMDYTLAPYVKRNIEELSFRLTAERLVKAHGYPEEVLTIEYDPRFVVRGLAVDKRLGNLLKMNGHNYVGRAYHGRRPLSKEERIELYRNQKIRLNTPRYYWLDTLFALPEAILYAGVIDLYENQLGIKKVAYAKLFEDIRESIDACHRDGSLKAIVKADLGRYIAVDPALPPTLHKLRSAGKRLFVLTNSMWDYTNAVMSFLLDGKLAEYPGWLNYFDVVIVGAGKPEFFTENREFRRVNLESGLAVDHPVNRLEPRGVYQGGSIRRFDKLSPGEGGDRVLYVGDHIYGDIIRSKKDSLWRTALILEELESELGLPDEIQRAQLDLVALEEHREHLDDETTNLKLRLNQVEQAMDDHGDPARQEELSRMKRQLRLSLDRKRRDLKAVIARREELTQQIDQAYNPYWGSVFKEGSELSRFGEQVEDYACLYTSRVSNFLSYSPSQYFRSPRHWMAHEKA
ncbi:MAG: HAD-IG family 5'-nucleotidase [Deltaproteobacteria bacterium]|nr:HAD-IG family 5'-nucleotidase [Deltaproteobacteria bacterium]